METSLRLRGGGGLRIHAKEKLPLGYNSLIQAHGEMDASTAGAAAPSYLALFVRQFYPQLSANLGVGVHLHKGNGLTYNLRAKKALPFTSNGLLGLNLKARLLTDAEFKPKNRTGAVELAWTILDLRRGQDVRLKLGYEFYDKAGRQHKAGEFVGLSMRAPVMVSRLHSAGNGPSPSPSPPLLCDGHADAAGDSDTVVILASLLCALICVAGLALVARCTCRRRNSGGGGGSNINPTATEVQAPKGLKKAAIETLPTVSLQAAAASRSGGVGEERECAICLVVLAEGDELRLLPLCGHGFHAACIDTWLGAHASCPSCRAAVLTCRRCGAAAAAT